MPSTFEAHKHQRSPLTVHWGLPLCAHSSQPHYAGSNHHAPPPALALLRWWHLAYCQVGGLSKAPQFTPRAAPQATTNQHNQAIRKVRTPLAGSVRKSTVTTELPYTCFVTRVVTTAPASRTRPAMSNAAFCSILQALAPACCDTHAGEQRKPEKSRHNATPSTFQAHKHQRSPLTVHLGLPLCTHSSQPHYAGSKHHAPPPAFAHWRWCHLAFCQVGPKACTLPHTRPTVRPSMAKYRDGLSQDPQFTPHAAPKTTANQPNQAIHKVNTGESTRPSNPQGQHTISPNLSEKAQSLQKYPATKI